VVEIAHVPGCDTQRMESTDLRDVLKTVPRDQRVRYFRGPNPPSAEESDEGDIWWVQPDLEETIWVSCDGLHSPAQVWVHDGQPSLVQVLPG